MKKALATLDQTYEKDEIDRKYLLDDMDSCLKDLNKWRKDREVDKIMKDEETQQ